MKHRASDGSYNLLQSGEKGNLILLKNNRRLVLTIDVHNTFKEFLKQYQDFRSPFFVPFDQEFGKVVLEELNPTIVYLYDSISKQYDDLDLVRFQ